MAPVWMANRWAASSSRAISGRTPVWQTMVLVAAPCVSMLTAVLYLRLDPRRWGAALLSAVLVRGVAWGMGLAGSGPSMLRRASMRRWGAPDERPGQCTGHRDGGDRRNDLCSGRQTTAGQTDDRTEYGANPDR